MVLLIRAWHWMLLGIISVVASVEVQHTPTGSVGEGSKPEEISARDRLIQAVPNIARVVDEDHALLERLSERADERGSQALHECRSALHDARAGAAALDVQRLLAPRGPEDLSSRVRRKLGESAGQLDADVLKRIEELVATERAHALKANEAGAESDEVAALQKENQKLRAHALKMNDSANLGSSQGGQCSVSEALATLIAASTSNNETYAAMVKEKERLLADVRGSQAPLSSEVVAPQQKAILEPKWSESIGAYYLPRSTDSSKPEFGTIDLSGFPDRCSAKRAKAVKKGLIQVLPTKFSPSCTEEVGTTLGCIFDR